MAEDESATLPANTIRPVAADDAEDSFGPPYDIRGTITEDQIRIEPVAANVDAEPSPEEQLDPNVQDGTTASVDPDVVSMDVSNQNVVDEDTTSRDEVIDRADDSPPGDNKEQPDPNVLVRTENGAPSAEESPDAQAAPPPPNPEVLQKLEAPVSIEFEGEHIAAIAAFIASYAGVPIEIDNKAVAPKGSANRQDATYVTDGVVPYVKLEHVPLKDALKAMLRPLGLVYEVRGDTIYVSTPDRLHSENPPSDAETRSKLDNVRVSISFRKGTTLMEAVAKLVDSGDVNIVIDRRAVSPDNGTNSDPTAWMVQPGKFNDKPLLNVLREILEPLGLTFAVQPGFIWISTPDRIATESFEELETRTYPLDRIPGLNGDAASREAFLATIWRMVRVAEPDTGKAISRVAVDEKKSALVITSAPSHLDDLEKLLLNAATQKTSSANAGVPQATTVTEVLNTTWDLFSVEFQSYELPRREMERVTQDWSELAPGVEVLFGEPRVFVVPDSIVSPHNALRDVDADDLGSRLTRMTYGSAAKYALITPGGITLPGFDLRGYLGHAPDFRREVFKPDLPEIDTSIPQPNKEQGALKNESVVILPGLERGSSGPLLEVLWQVKNSREANGQGTAFMKYPVTFGQWTAITFPKSRSQCYLVFARRDGRNGSLRCGESCRIFAGRRCLTFGHTEFPIILTYL